MAQDYSYNATLARAPGSAYDESDPLYDTYQSSTQVKSQAERQQDAAKESVWKGIGATFMPNKFAPAHTDFEARGLTLPDNPYTVQASTPDYNLTNMQDRQALAGAQQQSAQQAAYLDQVQRGQAGSSLAELQMRAGLEQSQRQALGTALAGRGGTAAQIAAQRQQTDLAATANQQAAQLRAQEQATAREQYGAALGQQLAGAEAQGGLTAQQAGVQQGWQAQQLEAQQANQQAWLGSRGIEADTYNAAMGANAGTAQANLEAEGAGGGSGKRLLQGLGAVVAMSDERSKEQIRTAKADGVREFLQHEAAMSSGVPSPIYREDPWARADRSMSSANEAAAFERSYRDATRLDELTPVEYQYRPEVYGSTLGPRPVAAPGERVVGVTTQDLSAHGMGDMVRDTPQGQGFDTGRAASTALAGSAQNSRDIADLEEELRRIQAALGGPSAVQRSGL